MERYADELSSISLIATTRNVLEFLGVTAATEVLVFDANSPMTTAWLPGGGSAATVICRAWTRTVAEDERGASTTVLAGGGASVVDAFSPDAIHAGGI
ncbi:hypothetical protein JQ600_35640 [Bradyrhizobium sp. AUGA SZCCT0176]|uniref:hypothetical protein n=1 Tax=Bradyrhizobium sp. AUGA SZCCT0176 TaxID=2807664 RepID=UPI001BA879EF|nr:hypothetical protein [Bradyrhizobium sp. AUGA SZCCT0176]MBR1230231.1 hypothetical protein [Bradyrhizobium sp. AUGA SZCCT0176]